MLKLITLAVTSVVLLAPAVPLRSEPVVLPPGYWPLEKSQPAVAGLQRLQLEANLSQLSAGERRAVSLLIEAGQIFQRLFELQRQRQAPQALADLQALDQRLGSPVETQNLLILYRHNRGPIATNLASNQREPFLPVEPSTPGGSMYPWGIARDEVEAWLAAHPRQRGTILNTRTVVRRADAQSVNDDLTRLRRHPALAVLHPGLEEELVRLASAPDAKTLYAIPYSLAYAEDLLRAYSLINDAARAVEDDDEEFAHYLRNRARDLLSDDYESGDAAWVTRRFKKLNAAIGAYESYSDELYGIKTTFGLSILLDRG